MSIWEIPCWEGECREWGEDWPFLETEEFVIYSYINNPFLLLLILLLSGWNFSDRQLLRGPVSVRFYSASLLDIFCLSIPTLGDESQDRLWRRIEDMKHTLSISVVQPVWAKRPSSLVLNMVALVAICSHAASTCFFPRYHWKKKRKKSCDLKFFFLLKVLLLFPIQTTRKKG